MTVARCATANSPAAVGLKNQPTINGATQYTTSPLPAGITYYWRARSINVYGEKGAWSGYRSFKVTQ